MKHKIINKLANKYCEKEILKFIQNNKNKIEQYIINEIFDDNFLQLNNNNLYYPCIINTNDEFIYNLLCYYIENFNIIIEQNNDANHNN